MDYNPYSYYIFLRWTTLFITASLVFIHIMKEEKPWIVSFFVVGIIYNPILSIHLTRPIWTVINLLTIIMIVLSVLMYNTIFQFNNKND